MRTEASRTAAKARWQDLLHRLGLSLAQLLLRTLHFQPQLILSVDVGLLEPFLTRLRQIIAERPHVLGDRRVEGSGLPAQLVVAHALELGRERVDLIYDRLQALGFALTGIAKGFSYQVFEHGCYSLLVTGYWLLVTGYS